MKDTEKKSWVYYVAIFLVKIWYAIMFKVEIIGKENIPETGNGVICSNHYSNYDPVSTAIYLDRLPHYIAKKELFKNKLFSWVLDQLGVFPIDRKVSMDMKAVKTAIKLLKEGKIVGIFAEGRRVKAGEDVAAKAGVALFAMKGNAPVIPCAMLSVHICTKMVCVNKRKLVCKIIFYCCDTFPVIPPTTFILFPATA